MTARKRKRVATLSTLFSPLSVNGQELNSMSEEQLSTLINAWNPYIERLTSRPGGGHRDEETLGIISLARLRRGLASLLLANSLRLFEDTDWVLAERADSQEVNTAHLLRAQGYETLGQYERASEEWGCVIACCEQANKTQAEPFDGRELLAEIYVTRATLFGELGRYPQAIEDCDQAEKLDPSCARLFSVRGLAFGHLGQAERAYSDCSRSIELGADDPDCYFRRAHLLISFERFREAFDDFGRALELDPTAAYIERARNEATLVFLHSTLSQLDTLSSPESGEHSSPGRSSSQGESRASEETPTLPSFVKERTVPYDRQHFS